MKNSLQPSMHVTQPSCRHRIPPPCRSHPLSALPTAHQAPLHSLSHCPASRSSQVVNHWARNPQYQSSCRLRCHATPRGKRRGSKNTSSVTEFMAKVGEEVEQDNEQQAEYISHAQMMDQIQAAINTIAPENTEEDELRAELFRLTVPQLKQRARQFPLFQSGWNKPQLVEFVLKAERPDQASHSGATVGTASDATSVQSEDPPASAVGSEPSASSSDRPAVTESELEAMTIYELRNKCTEVGVLSKGTKKVLIKRVLDRLNPDKSAIPSEAQLAGENMTSLRQRCHDLGLATIQRSRQELTAALLEAYKQMTSSTQPLPSPEPSTSTTDVQVPSSESAASQQLPQPSHRVEDPSSTSAATPTPAPSPDSSSGSAPSSSSTVPAPAAPPNTRIPTPPARPPRGDPVPVIFTDHRKKRRIVVKQGQHPEDIATEVVKGLTSRFNESTMVIAKGLNATVLALRALASASTQLSQKGFLMGFQHWHLPDSPEKEDRNFAFVLHTVERFKLPVKETFKVARGTYPPKLAAFLSRQLLDHETPSCSLEIRSALALIRALEGTLITRKIMHRPFKDLLLFVRVQPDHMPRASNDLGRYVMQLLAVKVQRSKPTALSAYRWESERLQELQEAALAEVPLADEEEVIKVVGNQMAGDMYEQVG